MDQKEVMEKVKEIEEAQKAEVQGEKYPEVEKKPEITIDDFDKIQIQVGEVIKCEPVKKAKKLLVSQIKDLAQKQDRLFPVLQNTISLKKWLERKWLLLLT